MVSAGWLPLNVVITPGKRRAMSGLRVGRQAQMIPVLHSIADQAAAPTLSSCPVSVLHGDWIVQAIRTGRVRRVGDLLQAHQTDNTGYADAIEDVSWSSC